MSRGPRGSGEIRYFEDRVIACLVEGFLEQLPVSMGSSTVTIIVPRGSPSCARLSPADPVHCRDGPRASVPAPWCRTTRLRKRPPRSPIEMRSVWGEFAGLMAHPCEWQETCNYKLVLINSIKKQFVRLFHKLLASQAVIQIVGLDAVFFARVLAHAGAWRFESHPAGGQ